MASRHAHPWLDPSSLLAEVLLALPANLQRNLLVVLDRLCDTGAYERQHLCQVLELVNDHVLNDRPAEAAVMKAIAAVVAAYSATATSLEAPR